MGKNGSKIDELDYTTTDSEDDPDYSPPPSNCGYCDHSDCEECSLLDDYTSSESSSDDDTLMFNFQGVINDQSNDIDELKKIIRELTQIIMNCNCYKDE